MKLGKEWKFLRRLTSCIFGTAMLGTILAATAGTAAAAVPTLSITPGPYHNGQLINVSVGPNRYFTPYSRIIIIECADPGGKANKLPTSVSACDGNTIQGNTILVQRNGSFSDRSYQVYALPNASQLGETADTRPICNGKHSCVFYIGQNQEKFTSPKIWSPPFSVSKSGTTHS
jgi:hypothetical protein